MTFIVCLLFNITSTTNIIEEIDYTNYFYNKYYRRTWIHKINVFLTFATFPSYKFIFFFMNL